MSLTEINQVALKVKMDADTRLGMMLYFGADSLSSGFAESHYVMKFFQHMLLGLKTL